MRRAVLFLAAAAAALRPKARSLEEWIDGLTLEIAVDYKETFSGIKVEVKDMECEDLEIDIISAVYKGGTVLELDLDDLNANCEGEYKWSYNTGLGKVKGDGKVEAKVRNSRIEVEVDVRVDAKGAPFAIEVDGCKADVKITDLETRGDALGAALNPFLNGFADLFKSDIEDLICDSVEDQAFDGLDKLIDDAGFGNCLETNLSASKKSDAEEELPYSAVDAADFVDWHSLLKNASGPGARLASAAYKAASKPSASDVVAFLFDAAHDLDAPLAGVDSLTIDELELIKMEPSSQDFFSNISVSFKNASVASSVGSLGRNVPREDVDAYADARQSRPEEVAFGLRLPTNVAFNTSTALDVTFAIDYLADWIDQAKRSPVLTLRADLGVDLHDLSFDTLFALGVVPRRTRAGLDSFSLGDLVDLSCVKTAFDLLEVAFRTLTVDYERSRLFVENPRFISSESGVALTDTNVLEVKIAQSVLPALIDLVDLGLSDFVGCVVDELVATDLPDTLTEEARHFFGATTKDRDADQCLRRQDERASDNGTTLDARVVDLSESTIVKRLAKELADVEVQDLLRTLTESLAEGDVESKYSLSERRRLDDQEETARSRFVAVATSDEFRDHVIVVAKNAADKIRFGPIATTLRLSDVFIANLDRVWNNVTIMPGGKDALSGTSRVRVLGPTTLAMEEFPLIAGLSLEVKTPVGNAEIALNVSFSRITIEDLAVDLYVDEPTWNGLNVGKDLGLSRFFTKGASFSLPSCLASSLQAASVGKLPKIHVGAVGLGVWSDVAGVDSVVEAAAKTAISLVNDFVTTDAAREELTWLLNDVIDSQLKTARKTCEKLSAHATTAPRRDARGDRPSAVARDDSDGVSGNLALAADAFSVLLVLAVMFATFLLIWLQRKNKQAARGALRRFLSIKSTFASKPSRPREEDATSSTRSKLASSVRKSLGLSSSKVEQATGSPASSPTAAKDDAATEYAEAYVGLDDEEEEEPAKVIDEAVPAVRFKKSPALITEAPLPLVLRYGLLAVMIGNVGLLVSSNVEIAAQARIRLRLELRDVGEETVWLGTDSKFSLVESVTELWNAGSILLALLVALLSGAWPYLEIGLLAWGYVTPNLDPKSREWVWRSVEMLSKWSFIDVFIVVFMIVAFYIEVDLKIPDGAARGRAELFIEARYAFYAFCFATLTSMCLGQVVLNLHREVHHLGRSRLRALEDKVVVDASEPKEERRKWPSKKNCSPSKSTSRVALAAHPLHGKEARWWQQWVVGPAILAVAVLFAVAVFATQAVAFEVGGAAGFLIDITDGSDRKTSYAAPEIALALTDSSPNDGWRPLVRVLEGIVLVFAVVVPATHVLLLGVLWQVPLSAPTQVRLLALAEVAYGWASLDVYLVTILATATQLNKLSEELAKDQCRAIDGYLRAFFDQAIDGDLTCFSLAVHVRPGCVFLAIACACQMILGYVTSSVTTACVAERVVQTALGDAVFADVENKSPSHDPSYHKDLKDDVDETRRQHSFIELTGVITPSSSSSRRRNYSSSDVTEEYDLQNDDEEKREPGPTADL